MSSKLPKAILITCAFGGVALVWSWDWSGELERSHDETTFAEVVSRADLHDDITVPQESNLELTKFFASGRVVDSAGEGILDAWVIVQNSSQEKFSVSTKEDGSFVLGPLLASNPVEINISAQGFNSGKVRIEADDLDVLVTLLRTGRLEGKAIDIQSNRPVDHFTVSLFGDDKILSTNTPDVSAIFHEQTGIFVISDLEHVQMDLFARADGYQPLILHGIAVSEQTEYVELKFEEARTIAGRVISASLGEVIVGAEVIVLGPQAQLNLRRPGPPSPLPGQTTKTSEDGTFSLNELSREELNLHIRVDGYVSKTINVGSVDEGDIEVLLAPAGSVAGRLIGVDGNSPSVGSIVLLNSETGNSFRGRISEEGRFYVKNLEPGDYVLSARSSAGSSGQMEIALGEAEHLYDLKLQVVPGNKLTGRISGLMAGEAALDVSAKLSGRHVASKKVGIAGNYELNELPTGVVEIVARTMKGRSLSQLIKLQADSVAYLDFVFDGTASIGGRITRRGTPIKNMPVNLIPVNRDQPRGTSRTSEDGRYFIEGLADSKYQFNVNGEGKRYITLSGNTQLDVDL